MKTFEFTLENTVFQQSPADMFDKCTIGKLYVYAFIFWNNL